MVSHHHHQNQDDDYNPDGSAVTSENEMEKTKNSYNYNGCVNNGGSSSGEKPVSSQNHVCGICGKSFNSGKALGGHKRSHVQARKKEGESRKKGNCYNGIKKSSSSSSSKSHNCRVCSRGFPSEKSLHGHMRSHPERDWRGVLPPHPVNAKTRRRICFPNSDTDGDDADADAADPNDDDDDDEEEEEEDIRSRFLSKDWGWFDKAGYYHHKRKLKEMTTYSEKAINAVIILTVMSRSKWPESPQHVKLNEKYGGHCDELNAEKTSSESGDEEDSEEEDANCTKVRYMNGALKGTTGVRDLDEKVVVVKENGKRKKLVVKIKLPNSESKAENSRQLAKDEYQCDICVKSFSTPQALGGHKSSHYKEKNNRPSSHEAGGSSQAAVAREAGARVRDFDLNDTLDEI